LLPIGLVLAWGRLRRRISDPAQLERDASLPLLGTVARLSENPVSAHVRRSRRLEQRWDQYRESVEYVRVNLAVSDALRQVQSIVVASAVSHEGKTRLATALAVSLAGADRDKTLLIDGDLRSPDVHRQFEMPNESGLADVLSGRCDWRQTIVQPRGQQLHVMPAGRALQSPNSLLCGSRLGELLSELRSHYRFIIIDVPPVLLVSDGLVLANAADGTLLVTLHNHSRETEVRSAVERLQMAGARLLGTVLNAVPSRRYGYGAYGYGIPAPARRPDDGDVAPRASQSASRPMAPETA
jgi:capsular exopolysaccharide synthesis family protein